MRESVRTFGLEARACLRQGALMLRGNPRTSEVPDGAARVVAFVHGYGATGPVFGPMRDHVERELGVATIDFSYGSFTSFPRVAADLADRLDRAGARGARLDLVGHSLGGLLGRWYVQEMGGASHVGRVVTLATPHAGTASARIAPGPLRRAMLPGNPVVRRLASGRNRARDVEHTALVAAADIMVTPPDSAGALEDALVLWFEGLGHNAMLFDEGVHAAVVDALRE